MTYVTFISLIELLIHAISLFSLLHQLTR